MIFKDCMQPSVSTAIYRQAQMWKRASSTSQGMHTAANNYKAPISAVQTNVAAEAFQVTSAVQWSLANPKIQ
jgi:hypothetical protein